MSPIYQQVQQFLRHIDRDLISPEQLSYILTEIERFIAEIPPTFDELEPFARSLGVEIHKQFHLLKNDLLFWQAARQAETQQKRWQQIHQRLATIETYSQQLLHW
ncbi:hypothetical protein GlitD10_1429 [Gloeomargarita lithophora Alchichica-D10]|uniref:Uncharacterized protein n=1 Tax=Gloeomargarita lithophora Alchichica-D10 TaxID=1188229 RepID=A0A1J0ACT5_9CYAN|nr:heterocyst frequency control protein PatD [Gloeomargarita lithophora]APB33750.1 hypothetical protein GlitD10_1429 [Gloeomargarita lithophora Alchichica-D10]